LIVLPALARVPVIGFLVIGFLMSAIGTKRTGMRPFAGRSVPEAEMTPSKFDARDSSQLEQLR
jgi:hypothetical protein